MVPSKPFHFFTFPATHSISIEMSYFSGTYCASENAHRHWSVNEIGDALSPNHNAASIRHPCHPRRPLHLGIVVGA